MSPYLFFSACFVLGGLGGGALGYELAWRRAFRAGALHAVNRMEGHVARLQQQVKGAPS